MEINADLTKRAVVATAKEPWGPSPEPGVERKMLDRDGGEVARVTSLVRFAPNSRFPEHEHGQGEEFLVLEGTFSDETGDYPAGTYVRHPPGSRHAPFSREGCVLFVKLRQMAMGEPEVVVDTRSAEWKDRGNGLSGLALYHNPDNGEQVYLVRFAPGAKVENDVHPAGEELFVLDGALKDEHGRYETGTWIRQPAGSVHSPHAPAGCTLYVKRGHLKTEI